MLLNGVFSGAEIAVLSLRKTRLAELLEQGSARARAVDSLRRDPERFLATVQIGITVVGASAAAFGGASFAERLAPSVAAVPTLAPYADQIAFSIVVALVSYLSLVLGELVPKSLALRNAEGYALLIAPVLSGISRIATPIVWVLTESSNLVLRVFGDRTTFTESRLSREELQQMMEEAGSAGSVAPEVSEIASRAIDFDDLDAYDVMVPARNIVALDRQASLAEVARVAREHTHTRVPVFEGHPDNITGFINLREVLAVGLQEGKVDLGKLMHPIPFVAENMAAHAVLNELQAKRSYLAIVVDEQGSVRGMITMEDLLSELVGEMISETDRPKAHIRREDDGSYTLLGSTPVHEANRTLAFELPEGEGWSTVAGLCIELAGRIPAQGAVLTTEDGVVLEVVEATPRGVKVVRASRKARPADDLDALSGPIEDVDGPAASEAER
ncbi:hemolysin family protein [Myxococcota bacterium]|nr:hemolysin family protein [Myxococcota bacterium]